MTNNIREQKGKEIANREDQIKRIDDYAYKVKSQSSHEWYDVVSTERGWFCTCKDHIFRHICCKHIHAVEFSIKLRNQVKGNITIKPITISNCLFCKSDSIKKFGVRHNKSSDIQRLFCVDCEKTFSINIGFEKMKHDPKGITTAMQLYFSGESLRNVAKSLRLLGMDVTHQTVYTWIKKYTKLMQTYVEKLEPKVSDTWRADEMYVKIMGNQKYLFAMMDDETRFWIAQEVADTKHLHDTRNLLRESARLMGKKPKLFITDGGKSYHQAYTKEWWGPYKDSPRHLRHIRLRGDNNNNKMERLNGEIRDREKVMRGLKKKDTPILTGYQLFHNYIRPHMGLDGKTPAEKCGIEIQGDNKWITMIQNASQDNNDQRL